MTLSPSQVAEEWRSVVGYEGLYEVSDLGRVRTIRRKRGREFLMPQYTARGYFRVNLTDSQRKESTQRIHRLVLLAFVGVCPEGHECSHLDGNRTNNRLSNLAWEPMLKNQRRKIEHGTQVRGEQVGTSKLTAAIVRDIRARVSAGENHAPIAKRYGIHVNYIWRIITAQRWKHI